ncbi:MAG: flp pilus-assembly TadE/G-like family protein [Gordonia sp. (in: high G+C Gram-positive bacteria)]|uniref:Rv3654c family TadE-like protein n=1 Tax=Gordonia sp. (in: high G+C Gram-positive bacteria) TaxID=84139 RepID=UPI0039E51E7C
MRRLLRDEEGAATVLGVAVVAALIALTAVLLHLGSAVLARHRAASAADLAALAAASALVGGEDDPCPTAARVVRAQGDPSLRVSACTVDGEFVELSVALPVRLGPFGVRTATARARAGPVGG